MPKNFFLMQRKSNNACTFGQVAISVFIRGFFLCNFSIPSSLLFLLRTARLFAPSRLCSFFFKSFLMFCILQVCRYDYVEIKDKDDVVLGKFCGRKTPQTITSSSNVMWVEFHSDHTQSRRGFSAVYYAGIDRKLGVIKSVQELKLLTYWYIICYFFPIQPWQILILSYFYSLFDLSCIEV